MCADDLQILPVALAALFRNGDLFSAAEVVAGEGGRVVDDLLRRALRHDGAAVNACTGADVDDVVGRQHRFLVVLDDDEGIADVAQRFQGVDELVVVALMEADARLVQDIKDAHQRGADLCCEADALCLAARKRARATGEGQIIEADVGKKAEARAELLDDVTRDGLLGRGEGQRVYEGQRFVDRQGAELVDVFAAHRDGKNFVFQAASAAVGAGDEFQKVLVVFVMSHIVALFDDVQHAVEADALAHAALFESAVDDVDLVAGAAQQGVQRRFGIIAQRRVQRKAVALAHRLVKGRHPGAFLDGFEAVDVDGAFGDREGAVGADQLLRDGAKLADAGASFAGAQRIIEGKHPRRQLGHTVIMLLAGVILRIGAFGRLSALRHHGDDEVAARDPQGVFGRVGQSRAKPLFHHQTVDHDLDGMLFVFVEGGGVVKTVGLAVDTDADVAVLFGLLKYLLVPPLLGADDGCQQKKPRAFGQSADIVEDLVDALLTDLLAADGAMGDADAGVHQTQIIVDLGDGADGGAGVLGGGLLVDGDGGRKAFDEVDVWLVHLPEEHTGVGGQRFHEAAVSLGVEGVEGQGRLARARQAGEDDQLVAGDGDVNIFQIMDAGALDGDFRIGHKRRFLSVIWCEGRRSCRADRRRARSQGVWRLPSFAASDPRQAASFPRGSVLSSAFRSACRHGRRERRSR